VKCQFVVAILLATNVWFWDGKRRTYKLWCWTRHVTKVHLLIRAQDCFFRTLSPCGLSWCVTMSTSPFLLCVRSLNTWHAAGVSVVIIGHGVTVSRCHGVTRDNQQRQKSFFLYTFMTWSHLHEADTFITIYNTIRMHTFYLYIICNADRKKTLKQNSTNKTE